MERKGVIGKGEAWVGDHATEGQNAEGEEADPSLVGSVSAQRPASASSSTSPIGRRPHPTNHRPELGDPRGDPEPGNRRPQRPACRGNGLSIPGRCRRPCPAPRRRGRPLVSLSCGQRRRRVLGGPWWGGRPRAARAVLYLGTDARHQPRQRRQIESCGSICETGGEVPALGRGLGVGRTESRHPQTERGDDDADADTNPRTHAQVSHGAPPGVLGVGHQDTMGALVFSTPRLRGPRHRTRRFAPGQRGRGHPGVCHAHVHCAAGLTPTPRCPAERLGGQRRDLGRRGSGGDQAIPSEGGDSPPDTPRSAEVAPTLVGVSHVAKAPRNEIRSGTRGRRRRGSRSNQPRSSCSGRSKNGWSV